MKQLKFTNEVIASWMLPVKLPPPPDRRDLSSSHTKQRYSKGAGFDPEDSLVHFESFNNTTTDSDFLRQDSSAVVKSRLDSIPIPYSKPTRLLFDLNTEIDYRAKWGSRNLRSTDSYNLLLFDVSTVNPLAITNKAFDTCPDHVPFKGQPETNTIVGRVVSGYVSPSWGTSSARPNDYRLPAQLQAAFNAIATASDTSNWISLEIGYANIASSFSFEPPHLGSFKVLRANREQASILNELREAEWLSF
jgi:hypothetical protein